MKSILSTFAFLTSAMLAFAQPQMNWDARYNNQTVNNKDEWVDIEVDGQGNSYLIGKSIGQGTSYDIIVSKVDNQGDIDWTYRLDGEASQYDEGVDIELDGQGNVYWIGNATHSGQGLNAIIGKLDGNGNAIWVNYYNNPNVNGDDIFNSLSVSNDGTRIAVGGETWGTGTNADYLYLITNQFGNVMFLYEDVFNDHQSAKIVDFFNNNNIAFISQDSSWTSWNGALVNMGVSIRQTDGTQVEYSSTVTFQNGSDIVRPIASHKKSLDEILILCESFQNNASTQKRFEIYRTDNNGVTGNYESDYWGTWDPTTTGIDDFILTDLVVDGSGQIYISGKRDVDPSTAIAYNGFVLCYDENYNLQWQKVFASTNEVIAIFPDNQTQSSVYVAVNDGQDFATYKLSNTDGSEIWHVDYNGPDSNSDVAKFLHVDSQEGIRVGGMSNSNANNNDGILVKYCTAPAVSLGVLSSVCVNASPVALSGGNPINGVYPGVSSGSFNPQVAGVGIHSVSYTYTNVNGCSATDSQEIVVHAQPSQPGISVNGPLQFCNGESVQLSAPNGYSYAWSPGNGSSQSLTVQTSGSYSVTVTDGNGCTNTSTATSVTVYDNPTVSIQGTNYFCSANSTTLTGNAQSGSGSITDYQWNIGVDGIGGANANSYPANQVGNYTLEVTNSNGCSTVSQSVNVSESSPPTVPTVIASGNTEFCDGESVDLTASVGSCVGCQYTWTNGNTSVGTNTNLSVTASGSYSITSTNDCGAESSTSNVVTVNSLPSVDAGSDLSVCSGDSIMLTNNSGTGACSWSPTTGLGNPNSCTTNSSPSVETQYTLTVVDANTSCENSDDVLVSVISGTAPTPSENWSHTYVSGGINVEFDLTNIGAYDFVSWDFGDGGTSNLEAPIHPYGGFGPYIVSVTGCIICSTDTICETSQFQVSTVSVSDVESNSVNIYPNPSNGQFELVFVKFKKQSNYQVFDNLGQLIKTGSINSDRTRIDMSENAEGVYMLRLMSRNELLGIERIVLMK